MTEAETKDFQDRAKTFNEKLVALCGELKIGIGAAPRITNDGRLAASLQFFDDKTAEPEKVEKKEEASGIVAA